MTYTAIGVYLQVLSWGGGGGGSEEDGSHRTYPKNANYLGDIGGGFPKYPPLD